VTLRFARPKSRKTGEPASRSTGDVDKHARNLLDALQDSGLFKDDAQVVNLSIAKRYCGPSEVPGAHIVVCGAA
jgi:Holliday junction resolvase RusA-like endonuclease